MMTSSSGQVVRRYTIDLASEPPRTAERIKGRIVEPPGETMRWAREVAVELGSKQ